MTETIEVRYRLISDPNNSPRPYYHKYIIYTQNDGTKLIGRGGPGFGGSGWGPLETEHVIYNNGHVDWDDANDDPRETVAPAEMFVTLESCAICVKLFPPPSASTDRKLCVPLSVIRTKSEIAWVSGS